MTPIHSLAEKDTQARTAVCAVCGPVGIYPAGRGWVCLNKKKQAKRAWEQDNPERVRVSRSKPGAHRLLERSGATGVCVICGSVEAVPWGRGWTCRVRADQLRGKQQDQPTTRCLDCRRWLAGDLTAVDGRCLSCWRLATPHHSLDGLKSYPRDPDAAPPLDVARVLADDMVIARWYSLNRPDDGKDRTRPSLKTLGARDVPAEWAWALKKDPDWGRLDQMDGGASTPPDGEGGFSVQYGNAADITGHPLEEDDRPHTLPELYRKFHKPGLTFPDFKAEYLARLHEAGIPENDPTVVSTFAYFGDDEDYTIAD